MKKITLIFYYISPILSICFSKILIKFKKEEKGGASDGVISHEKIRGKTKSPHGKADRVGFVEKWEDLKIMHNMKYSITDNIISFFPLFVNTFSEYFDFSFFLFFATSRRCFSYSHLPFIAFLEEEKRSWRENSFLFPSSLLFSH